MAERFVCRPFGTLREGQVLGHASGGQAHAALWRQLGPEPGDRRVDVGSALPRQHQFVTLHLGQLGNLLWQQHFQEGANRPDGHQEDEQGKDPRAPGDPAGRPEHSARRSRSWEGHEQVTRAVSLLLPTGANRGRTDL